MTIAWDMRELRTADGVRIRAGKTGPKGARGGFVILPGRGEFIEKYDEVAEDLASRGFASVVIDWRGQGLSDRLHADPQRFHARDFGDYQLDLQTVMDAFAPTLPRPHMMFAYSMGANIGLRWLHDHQDHPIGAGGMLAAILPSPMIDLPLGPRARMGARLLGAAVRAAGQKHRYLPGYGPYDPEKRWSDMPVLTSDQPRFAHILELTKKRPELAVGGPTYGWLGAAIAASDLIQRPGYPEAIKTPCLLVEASLDRIISRDRIAPYAARLQTAEHLLIEGSQHEILVETDAVRAQFFEAFDRFIAKHGATTGTEASGLAVRG